ncbi:autophagy-related protein 27 [Truncatella angustata]|uniref:Autophagy-related protein 27 n=1 Tax=Truncatella angustata TaxID=152316 RepID=A0A9P8URP9_9PEZI|nr:autophagy-related protein 27 [Truncatella angustata]KAH6656887.1 autophagy-related protein 27 [Truncatella angustata]
MKFSQIRSPAAAALLLAAPAASWLDCKKIVASERKFDLSPLGGPHSVTISQPVGPNFHNTTFTTDICRGLKRKDDVSKTEQCPHSTRVCAIERIVGKRGEDKFDDFNEAWAIAGELAQYGGGPLDNEAVYLPTSDSNSDAEKDGVRIIIKGGWHTGSNGQKRQQRAIIEFVCDAELEGTEGEWKAEDEYIPGDDDTPTERRSLTGLELLDAADEDGGEKEGDGGDKVNKPVQLGDNANQALVFNSYGPLDSDTNVDILRLTWKTKHACQKRDGDKGGEGGRPGDGKPSEHWGFFTWIVIIGFLGTASYLIFGSWLNYNRYGARGWDLLPHGDTIRDIPYLMKDWGRRVMSTVQGSGGRGGYAAV